VIEDSILHLGSVNGHPPSVPPLVSSTTHCCCESRALVVYHNDWRYKVMIHGERGTYSTSRQIKLGNCKSGKDSRDNESVLHLDGYGYKSD